jgi:hypothetical protein
MAGQAGIDHPGILHVIDCENSGEDQEAESYKTEQAQSKGRGPETLLKAKSQRSPPELARVYCLALSKRNKIGLGKERFKQGMRYSEECQPAYFM